MTDFNADTRKILKAKAQAQAGDRYFNDDDLSVSLFLKFVQKVRDNEPKETYSETFRKWFGDPEKIVKKRVAQTKA